MASDEPAALDQGVSAMSTVREVAKVANVSTGAVSMWINGRGPACDQKKRQIEAAIKRLGYTPRKRGRPGRRRSRARPRNVAFISRGSILDDRGEVHALLAPVIMGIRRALAARHIHLSMFLDWRPLAGDEMFQHFVDSEQLDGVMVWGANPDVTDLDWLQGRQIPTVLLQRTARDRRVSFATVDDKAAAAAVADHFHALGHRRMAMINRKTGDYPWMSERFEGFTQRVEQLGAEVRFVGQFDPGSSRATVERVCRRVLESGATAVFAVNDGLANTCIDQWQALDARIPRDLSVVGFDDLGRPSRRGLVPSSVTYDREALGTYAVQLLQQAMDQPTVVRSCGLYIETSVVDHDTTRPPLGTPEPTENKRRSAPEGVDLAR